MTASAHSTVGFVGNNLTSLGRKSEAYMTTHNEINNFSGSLKKLMRDLLQIQMLFLLKGLSAIESLSLQITNLYENEFGPQIEATICIRMLQDNCSEDGRAVFNKFHVFNICFRFTLAYWELFLISETVFHRSSIE